jgi:hypothetical protein
VKADEAVQRLEALCEDCYYRKANKWNKCAVCITEKWKQDFNCEYYKQPQKQRPDAPTSSQQTGYR